MFHIINLGCKVNRVEADSMAARLMASGAQQVALKQAKLVLINTCTVTGEADTKSRKTVRRALREAPEATVLVCGCGARASSAQFKAIEGSLELIESIEEALARAGELLGLDTSATSTNAVRVGNSFNTRVAIKIQDGCDHACSYCIVPTARGAATSTPLEQILEEIALNTQAGAREIVLTGIDLGSYQDKGRSLVQLLEAAIAQEQKTGCRFRLSSLELQGLTDELIEHMAQSDGRICAHVHVPLQAGSDAILRAMNREYDAAHFIERISFLKSKLPSVALATDVIVGFPGEREQDFLETMQVCSHIGFAHMHVFRYSARPGTPAAALPGAVEPELVAKRAERLRTLAQELTTQDALKRCGSTEHVLFESTSRGRSESYYPVQSAESMGQGNLVTMKLRTYEQGRFIAERC